MTNDSSILHIDADTRTSAAKAPSKVSVNFIRQFARTYTTVSGGKRFSLVLN